MSEHDDREQVRRATRGVGIRIGVACVITTMLGAAVLILIIATGSRHEGGPEEGRTGGFTTPSGDQHWVIDSWKLIIAIAVLAFIGAGVLSILGWLAARHAVAPLAAALRMQRNFVADASHELRTPLAVLDTRVQLLQHRLRDGEPVDDTVDRLREDAATMNAVLDDLLLAAEQAELQDPASTPVAATVQGAIAAVQPLAEAAGVRIRASLDDAPASAAITPVPFARGLVALLDNAVQHSPAHSLVEVSATTEDGRLAIRIRDHGSGIRGVAVERVFDRFAHGPEQGRRRGFGLGLSLVRDVMRRFGGTVEVEASSEQGTTFLLRLPLAA